MGRIATDDEWDKAEARELGELNPHRAWVLTDRDVWHRNPYYVGPPVPHPEFEEYRELCRAEGDREAERQGNEPAGIDDIPF